MIKNKKAFTLAEVLITLALIGVVAAMTLPAVINKYQEKVTVTKLEKFYSTMSQQIQMNLAREIENPYTNENLLSSYKIKKVCVPPDTSCANEIYYFYNGTISWVWGKYDNVRNEYYYAVLQDGTILRYSNIHKNCDGNRGISKQLQHICVEIGIDINGNMKPNTLGKDVFHFYATTYGFIPAGMKDENSPYAQFKDCKIWGYGCTYYVLEHKTLNYDKYKLW